MGKRSNLIDTFEWKHSNIGHSDVIHLIVNINVGHSDVIHLIVNINTGHSDIIHLIVNINIGRGKNAGFPFIDFFTITQREHVIPEKLSPFKLATSRTRIGL